MAISGLKITLQLETYTLYTNQNSQAITKALTIKAIPGVAKPPALAAMARLCITHQKNPTALP